METFWVACESAVLMPLNIIVLLTGFSWRSEHACQEEPDKSIIPHIHMLSLTFCPVPIWMTACLYNKQHARWLILKNGERETYSFYTILWVTHLLRIGKLSKHSLVASPVCVSTSLSFSFLSPQIVSGDSQGSWNENVWNENKMSESANPELNSLTFWTLFFNDKMSTTHCKEMYKCPGNGGECCIKSNIFRRDSGYDWILLTIPIPFWFFL